MVQHLRRQLWIRQPGFFDITSRPGSQLMWIALSFVIIFVILMLDSSLYDILAYFIYAAVILLLVATIFMAPDIKGSHSWLVLGPLRLQPAEFAKFATALAVSKLMNTYGFKLSNRKDFMRVMMLFLLPMILIMLQRDWLPRWFISPSSWFFIVKACRDMCS